MKPSCWWIQRRFPHMLIEARSGGGTGAEHLLACPQCANEAREISELARRLSGLHEHAPPSDSLASAVFARIDSVTVRDHPNSWARLAAATLAACATLALYLYNPSTSRTLVPDYSRQRAAPTIARAAVTESTGIKSTVSKITRPAYQQGTRRKRALHRVRPLRIRKAVRMALSKRRFQTRVLTNGPIEAVAAKPQTSAAISWAEMGFWYEANGNQRAALAAYSRGYLDEPSARMAFTAGRAAESTGDISTAIDFYSRALQVEPPSEGQESQLQKGSSKCIEPRTSV